MKRFLLLCLVALVSISPYVVPPTSQASQSETLSLESQILRLKPGNNWTFAENNGVPMTSEYDQMIDGEPQFELWPPTQAMYETRKVQSVYVYSATVLPIRSNYE